LELRVGAERLFTHRRQKLKFLPEKKTDLVQSTVQPEDTFQLRGKTNMIKRLVTWTMFSMTAFIASAASAQTDEVPTRFIDITEGLTSYGEVLRPDGLLTTTRDRPEFASMIELRRTFVNEIIESAEEID